MLTKKRAARLQRQRPVCVGFLCCPWFDFDHQVPGAGILVERLLGLVDPE